MTEVMLTVVIKGAGMFLLIVGGIIQILMGYKLYRAYSEIGPEKASIRLGHFNATTNSVGAFAMSTAALWAWAAVAVNPHLLKDAEKIEVTSISAPNIVFESPTIRGPYRLSAAKGGLKDPEAVKFLFTETVKHAIEQKNYTAFVALNKNPAQIDLATLQTLTTENGSVFVSAKVITKTAAARVAYAPQLKDGLVEFVPAGVGVQNIPPK